MQGKGKGKKREVSKRKELFTKANKKRNRDHNYFFPLKKRSAAKEGTKRKMGKTKPLKMINRPTGAKEFTQNLTMSTIWTPYDPNIRKFTDLYHKVLIIYIIIPELLPLQ